MRISARRRRVLEDRARDCLPVGALDAVTGSLYTQDRRTGDLVGQSLSVL